ncbi:hypothetical protein [Paeniglutamicibacter kerguelensis]|uniref:Uncharacterized protein n=1 Tax=Paeniglutamicibacter kerguelensis TaxID=254788 RepID=A0ABS4XCR3_9MICC|nr:hypothetical protein [Paeniglutamicibacter kerguelensis]
MTTEEHRIIAERGLQRLPDDEWARLRRQDAVIGPLAAMDIVGHPAADDATGQLELSRGIGITMPLGFTHLAATTPPERIGRTMGSAELGREAGDAGGPLIFGAVATTVGLAAGLGTLTFLIAVIAVVCAVFLRHDTRL